MGYEWNRHGRSRMIGWYFDVVVGFLIRAVIRFVKLRSSEAWPVEEGTISAAKCPAAVYGGPVAELAYTYFHKGNTTLAYTGKLSWWRVQQRIMFLRFISGRKSQCASNQPTLKRRLLPLMSEIARSMTRFQRFVRLKVSIQELSDLSLSKFYVRCYLLCAPRAKGMGIPDDSASGLCAQTRST